MIDHGFGVDGLPELGIMSSAVASRQYPYEPPVRISLASQLRIIMKHELLNIMERDLSIVIGGVEIPLCLLVMMTTCCREKTYWSGVLAPELSQRLMN